GLQPGAVRKREGAVMNRISSRTLVSAAALSVSLASLRAASPGVTMTATCHVAALSALNTPDVTIISATDVAASESNPEYCDVVGAVRTHGEGAGDGEARFEARLPAAWNRQYLATGPGGVAGKFFPSMNPVD